MKKFKFVDLFAGIGAFHLAMNDIGGECVFASEIDKDAIEIYKKNFNINADCDIFTVDEKDIPKHDVLCAGFPCQSFSCGGHKLGFEDIRGTLFFEIERILKYHKTKYILLENVKHLIKHDNGNTYRVIMEHLKSIGYILNETPIVISPHHLGIPQTRERVFILGIHSNYCDREKIEIKLPEKKEYPEMSVYNVLEENVSEKYNIDSDIIHSLEVWDELRKYFYDNKIEMCSPILVDEFEATYDYSHELRWKRDYCRRNREFYQKHKEYLDSWIAKYDVKNFKKRDRKLEWQAGKECGTIKDTVIQLRQSGIRCKRPNTYPTLLAINQTSILAKYNRRITPREAARLQSFPDSFVLPERDDKAYKLIGNSANVEVIKYIAKQLLNIE